MEWGVGDADPDVEEGSHSYWVLKWMHVHWCCYLERAWVESLIGHIQFRFVEV